MDIAESCEGKGGKQHCIDQEMQEVNAHREPLIRMLSTKADIHACFWVTTNGSLHDMRTVRYASSDTHDFQLHMVSSGEFSTPISCFFKIIVRSLSCPAAHMYPNTLLVVMCSTIAPLVYL